MPHGGGSQAKINDKHSEILQKIGQGVAASSTAKSGILAIPLQVMDNCCTPLFKQVFAVASVTSPVSRFPAIDRSVRGYAPPLPVPAVWLAPPS